MLSFQDRLPRRLYLVSSAVAVASLVGFIIWLVFITSSGLTDERPATLQVSQGTIADYIKLEWSEVDEAHYYSIFRDGKNIATTTDTSYRDAAATAGDVAMSPDITASNDRRERVYIQWEDAEVPDGERHRYTVRAVGPEGTSEPTGPKVGYRSGEPVTTYELSLDGGDWIEVGHRRFFSDTGAAAATIDSGDPTATEGEFVSHVALSLEDISTTPGEATTYRVRALSDAGAGAPSEPVEGRLDVGEPTIKWQRSPGEDDENFEDIDGATSPTYDDEDAPEDQSPRYYRAVLNAPGAVETITAAVRGHRAERVNCPISLGFQNVSGHQIVGDEVESKISYSHFGQGCAPGGGAMCDTRSCCNCMVDNYIELHTDLYPDDDYGLTIQGKEFRCSDWFPEVTVHEENEEVHVADAGECTVYSTKEEHRQHRRLQTTENSRASSPSGPSVAGRADSYLDDDGELSRWWLYERNTSHISFVGRIGSTCDMGTAVQTVERLHAELQARSDEDNPKAMIAILTTDLLRRSCSLTSTDEMVKTIDDYGHWFTNFDDLEESEQQRLRHKLLDLGSFAAAQGYPELARHWAEGLLRFELELGDEDDEFTHHSAANYLDNAERPELASAFRGDEDESQRNRESSATYGQWVRDFLKNGKPAEAAGAYALATMNGELAEDVQIEIHTALLLYVHEQIAAAQEQGDRALVAAHLWLLDDWLISEENSPFARKAASTETQPTHSDFPYVEVELPEERDDEMLYLSQHSSVPANAKTLDALQKISTAAHQMGVEKWYWPHFDSDLPLIRNPNNMPLLQLWFEEILRHQPQRSDTTRRLGDWHWHAAEWERGFSAGELGRRLQEVIDATKVDEMACDKKEQTFERLQRQVTEELVADQSAARDASRQEARRYYRRFLELDSSDDTGDEDLLPPHILQRLNDGFGEGCESQ